MKILTKDKLLTAYAKKRMATVGQDLIAHGRVVRDATWEAGEGPSAVSHRSCTIRRHDHLWHVSTRNGDVSEVKMLETETA